MPRESRLSITQNPEVQDQRRPSVLQVTARVAPIANPSSYASDFDGLLTGLKTINPET